MNKLFTAVAFMAASSTLAFAGGHSGSNSNSGTTPDMYVGISAMNFDIDFKVVQGVDLGLFYEEDYNASEIYLGQEFGNTFVEFGYFTTSTGTKSLSGTVSGIAFAGTTAMEFDGFRATVGGIFDHNHKLESKLQINYYGINFDESLALAVATGSTTFIGSASYSGTDDLVTVGYGLTYNINDQFGLGFDYELSLSEPTNIDEITVMGLNLTYKF